MAETRTVNINPKSFREIPLCELCFEDALKVGSARNKELSSGDFQETSIRFCVDGLLKWSYAYSEDYYEGSLFNLVRDGCWQWASFCGTDETMVQVAKQYHDLLREITDKTSYTDLADKLDDAVRVRSFGFRSRPFNVTIPRKVVGVVGKCGAAVGLPFSLFFNVGMAWSLSTNRDGKYSAWVSDVFTPLFAELMASAESRIHHFCEIKNTLDFRWSQEGHGLHK